MQSAFRSLRLLRKIPPYEIRKIDCERAQWFYIRAGLRVDHNIVAVYHVEIERGEVILLGRSNMNDGCGEHNSADIPETPDPSTGMVNGVCAAVERHRLIRQGV